MLKTDSEIQQAAKEAYPCFLCPPDTFTKWKREAYTAGYNQAKADASQTTEPAATYGVTMLAEAVPGGVMVEPVDIRERLEQLVEDYERRRYTLYSMKKQAMGSNSAERLGGKLEMCNNFLTEIGRILT